MKLGKNKNKGYKNNIKMLLCVSTILVKRSKAAIDTQFEIVFLYLLYH